jgi:hypothetical protein
LVSCASAGSCTALGGYTDSSGNLQGLLLTETAGTWAPGVEAPLPAGARSAPNVILSWVSCPSAGNCTAAGSYIDSSPSEQGLLLTQTSGTWAATEAPLAPNAATAPRVLLYSVSCASAGNCTAVGSYLDSSAHRQGLLLTQTSGSWAATETPLPAGAATNPNVGLLSVSCGSAGNCTAVGSYLDSSAHRQGLLVTQSVPPPDAPLHITHIAAGADEHRRAAAGVTFTDADPAGNLSQYSGTIAWGDGSTTAIPHSQFVTVPPRFGGGFAAGDLHTYAHRGSYTVTITITDIGGASATASTTLRVPGH